MNRDVSGGAQDETEKDLFWAISSGGVRDYFDVC